MLAYCKSLQEELRNQRYGEEKVRVDIDDRDLRGGEKKWYHVKRGVPIRIEVGPKDIAAGGAFVARRDTNQSSGMKRDELVSGFVGMLEDIQSSLFQKALQMRADRTVEIVNEADFRKYFAGGEEAKITQGGFAKCWFSSEEEVQPLLDELKVTIRCIPLEESDASAMSGKCFLTGKETSTRAVFAKSY